jgi:hypothetical protein
MYENHTKGLQEVEIKGAKTSHRACQQAAGSIQVCYANKGVND